tara:strand:+ start:7615 stop:12147 length:4533 start_codon:yes stop_codon:yes gene_type:complete
MSQKARHRLTGRHNSVLGGVSRDQTREYNVVLDVTEDTSIAFRREAECSHLYWDGTGEEPDISQLNNKEWYLDTVSVGRKKNADTLPTCALSPGDSAQQHRGIFIFDMNDSLSKSDEEGMPEFGTGTEIDSAILSLRIERILGEGRTNYENRTRAYGARVYLLSHDASGATQNADGSDNGLADIKHMDWHYWRTFGAQNHLPWRIPGTGGLDYVQNGPAPIGGGNPLFVTTTFGKSESTLPGAELNIDVTPLVQYAVANEQSVCRFIIVRNFDSTVGEYFNTHLFHSANATNPLYRPKLSVKYRGQPNFAARSSAEFAFDAAAEVNGTIRMISTDGTDITYRAVADGAAEDGDLSGTDVLFQDGSGGATAGAKAILAAGHLKSAINSRNGHNKVLTNSGLTFNMHTGSTGFMPENSIIGINSIDGTSKIYIAKDDGTTSSAKLAVLAGNNSAGTGATAQLVINDGNGKLLPTAASAEGNWGGTDLILRDAGPSRATATIVVGATGAEVNLSERTFHLVDHDGTGLTFTFNGATSAATGMTIGVDGLNSMQIRDNIVTGINLTSLSIGATAFAAEGSSAAKATIAINAGASAENIENMTFHLVDSFGVGITFTYNSGASSGITWGEMGATMPIGGLTAGGIAGVVTRSINSMTQLDITAEQSGNFEGLTGSYNIFLEQGSVGFQGNTTISNSGTTSGAVHYPSAFTGAAGGHGVFLTQVTAGHVGNTTISNNGSTSQGITYSSTFSGGGTSSNEVTFHFDSSTPTSTITSHKRYIVGVQGDLETEGFASAVLTIGGTGPTVGDTLHLIDGSGVGVTYTGATFQDFTTNTFIASSGSSATAVESLVIAIQGGLTIGGHNGSIYASQGNTFGVGPLGYGPTGGLGSLSLYQTARGVSGDTTISHTFIGSAIPSAFTGGITASGSHVLGTAGVATRISEAVSLAVSDRDLNMTLTFSNPYTINLTQVVKGQEGNKGISGDNFSQYDATALVSEAAPTKGSAFGFHGGSDPDWRGPTGGLVSFSLSDGNTGSTGSIIFYSSGIITSATGGTGASAGVGMPVLGPNAYAFSTYGVTGPTAIADNIFDAISLAIANEDISLSATDPAGATSHVELIQSRNLGPRGNTPIGITSPSDLLEAQYEGYGVTGFSGGYVNTSEQFGTTGSAYIDIILGQASGGTNAGAGNWGKKSLIITDHYNLFDSVGFSGPRSVTFTGDGGLTSGAGPTGGTGATCSAGMPTLSVSSYAFVAGGTFTNDQMATNIYDAIELATINGHLSITAGHDPANFVNKSVINLTQSITGDGVGGFTMNSISGSASGITSAHATIVGFAIPIMFGRGTNATSSIFSAKNRASNLASAIGGSGGHRGLIEAYVNDATGTAGWTGGTGGVYLKQGMVRGPSGDIRLITSSSGTGDGFTFGTSVFDTHRFEDSRTFKTDGRLIVTTTGANIRILQKNTDGPSSDSIITTAANFTDHTNPNPPSKFSGTAPKRKGKAIYLNPGSTAADTIAYRVTPQSKL